MRLIDADEFKKQVAAVTIRDNLVTSKCDAMLELIDSQPTACDMDKVVQQLQEYVRESGNADYNRAMIEAIEIIKAERKR